MTASNSSSPRGRSRQSLASIMMTTTDSYDDIRAMLDYTTVNVDPETGIVMERNEKKLLRERFGFCVSCESGPPTQLYQINKKRSLFRSKTPLSSMDCQDGICFRCSPDRQVADRSQQQQQQQVIQSPVSSSSASSSSLASSALSLLSSPQRRRLRWPRQGTGSSTTIDETDNDDNDNNVEDGGRSSPRANSGEVVVDPENILTATVTVVPPSSFLASSTASFISDVTGDRHETNHHSLRSVHEDPSMMMGNADTNHSRILGSDNPAGDTDENEYDRHSESWQEESTATTPPSGIEFQPGLSTNNDSISSIQDQQKNPPDTEAGRIIDGIKAFIEDICRSDEPEEVQFVVETIVGAMREHSEKEEVQSFCLDTISNHCRGDDKKDNNHTNHSSVKESFLTNGAHEYIVQAMILYDQSVDIQEKACASIWALAINDTNRVMLTETQCCQQIQSALQMESFMTNESCSRMAIAALRSLSPALKARNVMRSIDIAAVVVQAMSTHPMCVAIQRDGCAILSNLAVDIEKQSVMIVPKRQVQTIVQAMSNHQSNLSVLSSCVFTLKNLTHEEENCRLIKATSNSTELLEYAMNVEDSKCRLDAGAVVEKIHLTEIMDLSVFDFALIFLQILESSKEGTDLLEGVIEYMEENASASPQPLIASLQALQNILQDPNQRIHLHSNGHLSKILTMCRQHRENNLVISSLCGVIVSLSQDLDKHDDIVEGGWHELILEALSSMKEDPHVVVSAFEVLKSFSTNMDCMIQIRTNPNVLTDAIAAHPNNESIQMAGVELVSLTFYD